MYKTQVSKEQSLLKKSYSTKNWSASFCVNFLHLLFWNHVFGRYKPVPKSTFFKNLRCTEYFPIIYDPKIQCAKFQGWNQWFQDPSKPQKNSSPPYEVKKKISPKYGIIYIKRCLLKKLSQEKKSFWKIFILAWEMAKKLVKKAIYGNITIFGQFFGHFSG